MSGSGLAPSQTEEGRSVEGTTQLRARRSPSTGSPAAPRGSTRTTVSASARSLSTITLAKASTSSIRTPLRGGTISRQEPFPSVPSFPSVTSSGPARTRKSWAWSLVKIRNQPGPASPARERWSTAYSMPSRRGMITRGSAVGSSAGMANHSVVLVLCRPTNTKAPSRVRPVPRE